MRNDSNSKMGIKRFGPAIPGVFTFGNLICGFLALLHAMGNRPENAAWFIFLGAFLDLLDGKVARFTGTSTAIGIQLDSLADFLTFGVAPIAMMRALGLFDPGDWRLAAGILYIFAGAYRLARFNVKDRSAAGDYYIGLPIPVAAIAIAGGLLFIKRVWPPIYGTGMLGGMAVLAWLMISNVKYTKRLPRIDLSKGARRLLVIPVAICILALILFPEYCIYPLAVLYIFYGLTKEITETLSRKRNLREDSCPNEEIPSAGDS